MAHARCTLMVAPETDRDMVAWRDWQQLTWPLRVIFHPWPRIRFAAILRGNPVRKSRLPVSVRGCSELNFSTAIAATSFRPAPSRLLCNPFVRISGNVCYVSAAARLFDDPHCLPFNASSHKAKFLWGQVRVTQHHPVGFPATEFPQRGDFEMRPLIYKLALIDITNALRGAHSREKDDYASRPGKTRAPIAGASVLSDATIQVWP